MYKGTYVSERSLLDPVRLALHTPHLVISLAHSHEQAVLHVQQVLDHQLTQAKQLDEVLVVEVE